MLAATTMWTPLGAAQTLHCTSLQRARAHTHTLLLALYLFTVRKVPLKSNLSPSYCKLSPLWE